MDNNLTETKKKTLILTETNIDDDPMFNAWIDAGLNADLLFASVKSKVGRAIRRLWLNGVLPGASIWYGNWKNELNKYDTIIIHASELTRTIPRWIRKHYPSMRIIYWYWNPVNNKSLPSLINEPETELWSFDAEDCRKYGMQQNIQYYYGDSLECSDIKYDVYFVGHDKGRLEQINEVKSELERLGLTYKFDVIKDNEPNIPYNIIRENVTNSNAILEINQSGQEGCTLRALESLFLQKKLITSNKNIKSMPFYSSNNIYILGEDSYGLNQFLEKRFEDTSIYKKDYDIDAWIKNFK